MMWTRGSTLALRIGPQAKRSKRWRGCKYNNKQLITMTNLKCTLKVPRPTELNKYLNTDMVKEAKQALDNLYKNERVRLFF